MNETTTKENKFKKAGADNDRLPARPGAATKDDPPRWGLALGSGGARGLAHIGIFKALEKAGLYPDVITGTSIGALMGGAYACRPAAEELERRFYHVLNDDNGGNKPVKMINRLNWDGKDSDDFRHRFFRFMQREFFLGMARFKNGVCSLDDFRQSMEQFLPDIDLSQTPICFGAVTVDMVTGSPQMLTRGPIIKAVMASCAVPGFIPPVRLEDSLFMDGGLADPIPTEAARKWGAEKVIAVDVGHDVSHNNLIDDGLDTIKRATDIMSHHLAGPGRSQCDLLIEPLGDHVDWADYQNAEDLVRRGEAAGEDSLAGIFQLLGKTESAGPPAAEARGR